MIVKKYLTHNGNLIQRGEHQFVYRNYDIPYQIWVDLPYEYEIQGDLQRYLTVNLTGMPQSSDLGYFTIIFDAKVWGSSGGQARIIVENSNNNPLSELNRSTIWPMTHHFYIASYGADFIDQYYNHYLTWTTDPNAEQYVIQTRMGYASTLWPVNTYGKLKCVCDRNNYTCYIYIEDIYLGTITGFTNDLLTWNVIYLYSDQGRNYEIAGVKNIKVAGFSSLEEARLWNGNE